MNETTHTQQGARPHYKRSGHRAQPNARRNSGAPAKRGVASRRSQESRTRKPEMENKEPYVSNKSYSPKLAKETLRMIPIGGCEEVGRNMVLFEYEDDIVIVDMGIQFPEEDMPGINYIIPNIKYLEGKEKNVRGVVFTHGHLDHIGAAPFLLSKLGYPPIVARDLTLALIKHKQDDYEKGSASKLKVVRVGSLDDKVKLGKI
ncbi:MAG: hypothetical protein COU33_00295, partial [Candidatus Magasanikbacteria bacterium CG10_big_fil_rev_8_21_14_0_10_43_6]